MIGLIVISTAWFATGILVGVVAATPAKQSKSFDLTSSTITNAPKTYYLGEW